MIHGPNSPDAPTKKQIKAAQGPHDQPDSQLYLFPLRMTYLIAAIIGVAVLNHALRLIRQYRPMTGKTMMKIPGLAFTLALIRSVTCIRIRPIGPFVFPLCMHLSFAPLLPLLRSLGALRCIHTTARASSGASPRSLCVREVWQLLWFRLSGLLR